MSANIVGSSRTVAIFTTPLWATIYQPPRLYVFPCAVASLSYDFGKTSSGSRKNYIQYYRFLFVKKYTLKEIYKEGYKLLTPLIIIAFITFVLGDLVSTYVALTYGSNVSEGNSGTSQLINQYHLLGYFLFFIQKVAWIIFFSLLSFGYLIYGYLTSGKGYRQTAKFIMYGIIIYGLYLTLSNICVFLLGFPLMPPWIDQSLWSNYGALFVCVLFIILGMMLDLHNSNRTVA